MERFTDNLIQYCKRIFGDGVLKNHQRLTGGASAHNHYFEYGDKAYVMRCMADDVEHESVSNVLGMDDQTAIMMIASDHGILAPNIAAMLDDNMGHGFVMDYIAGETLPHKIFKAHDDKALKRLSKDLAEQLAAIHAVPIDALSDIKLEYQSPQQMIMDMRSTYETLHADLVIFEWAFDWLMHNIPEPALPALLHGDYRMGNIIVGENGLAAILDWELCHLGDPAQDLAYICAPSWRFGRYDNIVGGIDDIGNFLRAYEAAGGEHIDTDRFNFWLIYATLWWGMVCLSMAESWRSGADKSLEKIVIGTRISEVELDLLLMLERDCPPSQAVMHWELPEEKTAHHGATKPWELIDAIEAWDNDYIIPNAAGHDLFQARVARNAMSILKRDAAWGDKFTANQAERLAGRTKGDILAALRDGDTQIINELRITALEKISIDQPKYAARTVALNKWQNHKE